MQVEERLLEHMDTQSFNAFLKAWEQEMKANDRLVRDLRRVIKRNRQLIKRLTEHAIKASKSRTEFDIASATTMMSGLLGGGISVMLGVATGVPLTAAAGGVVGAAIALVGLVIYLSSATTVQGGNKADLGKEIRGVLPEHMNDEKIIADIERMRGMKEGLFGRLFGK